MSNTKHLNLKDFEKSEIIGQVYAPSLMKGRGKEKLIGELDKAGKNVKTANGWVPVKGNEHLITGGQNVQQTKHNSFFDKFALKFIDDPNSFKIGNDKARKRNLVAVDKKTGEQIIVGYHRRDKEGVTKPGDRFISSYRNINYFSWDREGLKKIFGNNVTISNLRRQSEKYDFDSVYSQSVDYSLKQLEHSFEDAYKKYLTDKTEEKHVEQQVSEIKKEVDVHPDIKEAIDNYNGGTIQPEILIHLSAKYADKQPIETFSSAHGAPIKVYGKEGNNYAINFGGAKGITLATEADMNTMRGIKKSSLKEKVIQILGDISANNRREKRLIQANIDAVYDNFEHKQDYAAALRLIYDFEANDKGKSVKREALNSIANEIEDFIGKKEDQTFT